MVDKIWYNMEELVGGSEERILIETYWNVKILYCFFPVLFRFDINRNILECKGACLSARTTSGKILIETYWNVKQFVECKRIPIFNINRNILECKGCSLPAV